MMASRPWYGLDPATLVPGVDDTFTSSRGHKLATRSWLPPPREGENGPAIPLGVIQFCHGYGQRVTNDEQYDMLADRFCRIGFACHGIDCYGHGSSPGKRCLIMNFDHIIEDNLMYHEQLVRHYSRLVDQNAEASNSEESNDTPRTPARIPYFLMGESMGGATAVLMATDGSAQFDGIILTAPMIDIDPELVPPKVVVSVITWMSKCWPAAKLVPGPPDQEFVRSVYRDPEKIQRALSDPGRYTAKTRLQTALCLQAACFLVQERMHTMTTPLLLIHGDEDKVTSPDSSRRAFVTAASSDKTFVSVAKSLHCVWWNSSAVTQALFGLVTGWLVRRATTTDPIREVGEVVIRTSDDPTGGAENSPGASDSEVTLESVSVNIL